MKYNDFFQEEVEHFVGSAQPAEGGILVLSSHDALPVPLLVVHIHLVVGTLHHEFIFLFPIYPIQLNNISI